MPIPTSERMMLGLHAEDMMVLGFIFVVKIFHRYRGLELNWFSLAKWKTWTTEGSQISIQLCLQVCLLLSMFLFSFDSFSFQSFVKSFHIFFMLNLKNKSSERNIFLWRIFRISGYLFDLGPTWRWRASSALRAACWWIFCSMWSRKLFSSSVKGFVDTTVWNKN